MAADPSDSANFFLERTQTSFFIHSIDRKPVVLYLHGFEENADSPKPGAWEWARSIFFLDAPDIFFDIFFSSDAYLYIHPLSSQQA